MARTTNAKRKRILPELVTIVLRTRQVWRLISPRHRKELLGAVILMAAAAYFNAHIPVVLGDLGTSMELAKTAGATWGLRNTWPFLAWLAGYFVVREALQVIFKYLVHDATTRVEKEISVGLVSHLLRVDIATVMQERVGSLHGRIRRSVEGLVRLLKLGFMDFWPSVFTAGFAMGMAIHRQRLLGLLMAGVAPIATFIVMKQIGSQKGIRLALLRSKENLDGTVVEQLGGIEYVRAAHTYEREVNRVTQVAEVVRKKEIKHHIAMSMYDGVKALNEGSFFILVVAFAISFAARGLINIGEVLAYALFFTNVLNPLREVHRIIDEAHESALKVGDLMGMLTEPVDRSFEAKAVDEPVLHDDGEPIILMKDLVVEYKNADGKPKKVLDAISLTIRQGETIGVAGRSGCGKSTWLRTLLRLVHPSAGTLLVSGVPIESVSRAKIGQLFGYVGQEAFLFSGSIQENIAYGCEDATIEEVRRAARMAGIDDEIMAMPGNYSAQIAERGKNVSGGQRQRIALARVFLKDPPILILDEATSALDNISERNVLRALTKAKTGRTVIMVAHRLSTLRDSDRILVFDQGRVVESGHYDDLMQAEGAFAELVRTAAEKGITRAVTV
jgi:ATP-binding cassette, subfamily B, bacterial